MSRHADSPSKRLVSESGLTFLHAQIVEYHLRGPGARFFDAPPIPPSATMPPESSPTSAPILSAKRKRLESLGQDVGVRLAERHAHSRDRLEHDLEMVKFICKDFWEATFNKQIDVLRTNHRGLYVLTDNNFRWLASVSSSPDHPGSAEDYVVFPCGLICGALTRLGLRCRVTAEIIPMPLAYKCSFNVQLIQNQN